MFGQQVSLVNSALVLLGIGLWLGVSLLGLRAAGRSALVRAALAAAPLLFLVYGVALDADLTGRAVVLSGLDDWLTYEGFARDILLNGPLMANGATHAAPYYAQPLYPYVLALAHMLTGESIFGLLVLQMAALGLVLSLTALLAGRLFGFLGGVAAFAWFAWFLQVEHLGVARQLFNENLYQPLVLASLLLLVELARRRSSPTWWQSLLVGLFLGVAVLARQQFLLFVPFALLILLIGWWRAGEHVRGLLAAMLIVLGIGAAIAPVTTRNVYISGQPVLIASSGGASLLGNGVHVPPPSFDRSHLADDPLYNALKLDADTRLIVDYARRDPLGYLATWLPGLAHSVGVPGVRQHTPSIVWGIVLTVAAYLLASLGLSSARRREVWLIQAFVLTHLVTLMAFEYDTYGYRLVVPMYAPMVVVAAQTAPALLGALGSLARRLTRVPVNAVAGAVLAFAALVAFAQQGRDLADNWGQRELQLLGLRGPEAWAVGLADTSGAQVVYVASVDGTPRTVSAGMLPGLRFPRLKWFDPSLTLPIPPTGSSAVFQLQELVGHPAEQWGLAACLGSPAADGTVLLAAQDETTRCVTTGQAWTAMDARFQDVAQVQATSSPSAARAGDAVPILLLWQPLQLHPAAYQTFVHVEDTPSGPDGPLEWGNGTRVLYPAQEWDPSEPLLSRLSVQTDPTAIPDRFTLSLGMSAPSGNNAPLKATWSGGSDFTVPIGTLSLSLAQPSAQTPAPLPAGLQTLSQPLSGGGLKLLAIQGITDPVKPGQVVRLRCLWQAMSSDPAAASVRLELVQPGGQVSQQQDDPLLGGRYPVSSLPTGAVVQDNLPLSISPTAPSDQLGLRITFLDAGGAVIPDGPGSTSSPVLTLQVQGRDRTFAVPPDAGTPLAQDFGGQVELAAAKLDPSNVSAGGTTTVHLAWRGLTTPSTNYKVFVHLLDASQQTVLAQHDGEPQDGQSPTSAWLPGEVVLDTDGIRVPPGTPAGDYPVEVGLYDPRTGDRLLLPDGQSRVILPTRLHVAG